MSYEQVELFLDLHIPNIDLEFRAVGRSENPGVPVLFGGHNLPPLVEIGSTNLPTSGGAMATRAPLGLTGLYLLIRFFFL